MPKLLITTRAGEVRELRANLNQTLMEVIRDEGIDIEALCGGCCSCATCHVYIDPGFAQEMPEISDDENLLLDGSIHRDPETSRLSCQIRLNEQMEGLRATVAPADD